VDFDFPYFEIRLVKNLFSPKQNILSGLTVLEVCTSAAKHRYVSFSLTRPNNTPENSVLKFATHFLEAVNDTICTCDSDDLKATWSDWSRKNLRCGWQ